MHDLEDHYWWFVGRRVQALKLIRKHLHSKEAKPMALDLGCGTGAATRALAEACDVVGVDMSPQALAFSYARGFRKLSMGDGEALPLRSNTFQVLMGLDVFEHIGDDAAAFREAHRVLAPGGILVMSVPAFRALWGPHDIALHHHRRYTRPELVSKLRAAGFEIRQSSYSVFFLFPLVLVSRLLEKLRPGPAHASLPPVPGWLNRALIGLQGFEASLIERGIRLPWGSSVLVVAQKV